MLRIFCTIVLVVFAVKLYAQPETISLKEICCLTKAMLDYDDTTSIPILDKPNGNVIYHIQNDLKLENFYSLLIYADSSNYFNVLPNSPFQKHERAGWINKEYVWIAARNYSGKLTLYTTPSIGSKPKSTVPDWLPLLYRVERCHGKWLYILALFKGEKYEGWLEPEMQCDNPYSTCP